MQKFKNQILSKSTNNKFKCTVVNVVLVNGELQIMVVLFGGNLLHSRLSSICFNIQVYLGRIFCLDSFSIKIRRSNERCAIINCAIL